MMKNLKKMTCLLFVIALVFSLISCAKAPEDIEPTDEGVIETVTDETKATEGDEEPTEAAEENNEEDPVEKPSENEGDNNGSEKTTPTDPTPNKPTEPAAKPTDPDVKPTEPKPTEPKPTEPKPTEPKATEPKPTEPAVHIHKYTDKVVEPTCTAKGYTLHTCSCGHSYKDKETAAKGHRWGDWETTKEATTEAEGEQQRTCSACGASETQKLDKIPVEVIDLAALEAYGRSYGASTYGFAANSGCYAGYFPAVTAHFTTMDEGRAAVRGAVSATASNLLAAGPIWCEMEDGTIARMYINVKVVSNGNDSYTIWVYYG